MGDLSPYYFGGLKVHLDYKLSEIDLPRAKKYLNLEDDFVEDDDMINMFIMASKDYISSYTGLSDEVLDKYSSFTVACLMLVSDFYEVRIVNLGGEKNSAINKMLNSILSMVRDLG